MTRTVAERIARTVAVSRMPCILDDSGILQSVNGIRMPRRGLQMGMPRTEDTIEMPRTVDVSGMTCDGGARKMPHTDDSTETQCTVAESEKIRTVHYFGK